MLCRRIVWDSVTVGHVSHAVLCIRMLYLIWLTAASIINELTVTLVSCLTLTPNPQLIWNKARQSTCTYNELSFASMELAAVLNTQKLQKLGIGDLQKYNSKILFAYCAVKFNTVKIFISTVLYIPGKFGGKAIYNHAHT